MKIERKILEIHDETDLIDIGKSTYELNDLINQDGGKKFVDNLILKYYNSSVI